MVLNPLFNPAGIDWKKPYLTVFNSNTSLTLLETPSKPVEEVSY